MAWSHRGGTSQPVYLTKEDIILTVITGNNFLFHIYYYQVSLVFSLLYFNMRYLNFISMIPHMTSNILTMLLVFSLYVYLKRLQLHGSSLCSEDIVKRGSAGSEVSSWSRKSLLVRNVFRSSLLTVLSRAVLSIGDITGRNEDPALSLPLLHAFKWRWTDPVRECFLLWSWEIFSRLKTVISYIVSCKGLKYISTRIGVFEREERGFSLRFLQRLLSFYF